MEVIKIDPDARYAIFVRDAPREWAEKMQAALSDWFASKSQAILINVPGQGQVMLKKTKDIIDETIH